MGLAIYVPNLGSLTKRVQIDTINMANVSNTCHYAVKQNLG
jgi:hypothetical protein